MGVVQRGAKLQTLYNKEVFMAYRKRIVILLCAAVFLFWSCDYGDLGDADKTVTYYPGDAVFTERMNFLCGTWYSRSAGIGLLDGYRIRKWNDLTAADKTKAKTLFPSLNINSPKTYSSKIIPQNGDYVLLFDDTLYGQEEGNSESNESWGFGYMGLVRAVNIFNGDKNRGAIIIEYFEGAAPSWLSDTQGLTPNEKPFFGIYLKTLSHDTVQLANPVDLAEMYAKKNYYTERGTLAEAVGTFDVENEAEFISWGVVFPQERAK
jgi:hypothetical protein